MALLSFDFTSHPSRSSTAIDHDAQSEHRKPLSAYGLLCLVFVFILGPQPSILLLSTSYYILIRKSWTWAVVNLGINYLLLFMMLSSLMVTLVRDPGPVKPLEQLEGEGADNERDGDQNDEDISLAEALLSRQEGGRTESFSLTPVKSNGESRWCRKCWAPKPERTHHCSECNRCVLKMDHHCPWLANRCVGARVYPSFLHFLLTTTIYSAFVFYLAFPPIQYYLGRPLILDDQDMTPYHAMTVALLGAFFFISVGSFFIYHMYLMLTNQTTLESLAPMLLLQYLPDLPPETDDHHNTTSTSFMAHDEPPPFSSQPPSPRSSTSSFRHNSPPPYVPPPPARGGPTGSGIRPGPGPGRSQTFAEPFRFPSPPPPQPRRLQEHELNKRQRQLIREAHARIRVYDLGWRENLLDVLGGPDVPSGKPRPSWVRVWAERVFWGGRGRGDGHSFRHNPRAEGQLRALAADLAAAATR